MYNATKQIHFCYGHRLLKHPGKCSRLHGHNAIAEIHCARKTLDSGHMVVDFDRITKVVKAWIDENLDHKMVLNRKDPLMACLKKSGEPFYSIDTDPTAECLAKLIYEVAESKKLPIRKVVLWETPSSFAS